MALDRIRRANKKARREKIRKAQRVETTRRRQGLKIRRQRTRKMLIQGRKEFNATKQAGKAYVAGLTKELADEK